MSIIALDEVPNDGLVYLAAPYSGSDAEVKLRMQLFCLVDAQLSAEGRVTVSPLMKHFVLNHSNELGSDWNFWKRYSQVLLSRCQYMIVVMLDGWDTSVGVRAEIELAKELNIPVAYLKPSAYLKVSSQKE